jgi:hypothetical protein
MALARRAILAQLAGEPAADRRVIGRRARIGARRQALAQGKRRRAVGLQRRQHLGEVGRLGADAT